ncbi:MAG TPA: hypothetical protein VIM38_13250 [Alphaproteobacteria bacterium]
MRTLKVVVIALGVLIVAAIAALVLKIADTAAPSGAPSRVERTYAPSTVEIPRGAEVIATEVAGERLVLHVRLENGDLRFIVVNLSTGKEIGSVDIREAPGKTL